MNIIFPPGTVRCNAGTGISFRSLLDGKLVVCDLPAGVLKAVFGTESNHRADMVASYEAHRITIERAARSCLESGDLDGRVRLAVSDFERIQADIVEMRS